MTSIKTLIAVPSMIFGSLGEMLYKCSSNVYFTSSKPKLDRMELVPEILQFTSKGMISPASVTIDCKLALPTK